MELSTGETLRHDPRGSANATSIIDLLPERTVDSVVARLETHSEVGIVSRDRGGVYVDGATQGAPLATQVCDRWHLLKNLGEAVEGFLIRAHIRLPETTTTAATQEGAEAASSAPTPERPLTTYSCSDYLGHPVRHLTGHSTIEYR